MHNMLSRGFSKDVPCNWKIHTGMETLLQAIVCICNYRSVLHLQVSAQEVEGPQCVRATKGKVKEGGKHIRAVKSKNLPSPVVHTKSMIGRHVSCIPHTYQLIMVNWHVFFLNFQFLWLNCMIWCKHQVWVSFR